MASIERTAYPRFTRTVSSRELRDAFTLSGDEDERTGGAYPSYNHACLAVFTALASGGSLHDAAVSEAARLDATPEETRPDIDAVTNAFYRKGLLLPAFENTS